MQKNILMKNKGVKRTTAFFASVFVFLFVLVLSFHAAGVNISAQNTIQSIDTVVTLNEDGSATFKEKRKFTITEGTEHYLKFANLGESELLDFTVYENGQALVDIGEWDVDASLEEKAGKYGVNTTSNGFELCFGVGSYGAKEFEIEYTISNVVRSLSSGEQAMYWQLLNPDMDPIATAKATVENSIGQSFSIDNSKIWGFGYEGTTVFESGKIVLQSDNSFSSDNYMVLLAIFENAPFTTSASYHKTAEEMVEQAMDGASLDGMSYEEYLDMVENGDSIEDANNGFVDRPGTDSGDKNIFQRIFSMGGTIIGVMMFLFTMLFTPLIFIFVFVRAFQINKNKKAFIAPLQEGTIYRDIPYQGPFFNTNPFVGAGTQELISAFLLKWIQEGRIIEIQQEQGLIFKKDAIAFKIADPFAQYKASTQENHLWGMFKAAADEEFVVSDKDFASYIRKNARAFTKWLEDIDKESKAAMKSEGFYRDSMKKFLFSNLPLLERSDKGAALATNIDGFKNYLKEYSLLNERNTTYVSIWDDYMIWAAYLGIAEEVYEQLRIADPHYAEHVNYGYGTIMTTRSYATAAQNSLSSSSSGGSSFSGGGGSSFSGGGGGASGGSSGGGSR